MKAKNILMLIGILLPVSTVYAQYAEDALRFSQTEQGATARFRGLGGAQTALGGDASSMASNPAGIALFTKSELTFTPEFSNSDLGSNYLGNNTTIQKDRAGVNQFGIVFYNPIKRFSNSGAIPGPVSFNFGIAYNKTNNFNHSTDYFGVNPNSSIGDYFADLARNPDDLLATNAYESFLIEDDPQSGYYPITDVNGRQQNTVYRTGSQSEVNLSLGINNNNKLYLGASLGIASINYNSDREFVENGLTLREIDITQQGLEVYGDTKPYLDAEYRTSYLSNQVTKGSGINVKLGMIYRASKSFRFGLNFTSPTWYSIDDTYTEGLNTRFNKASGLSETITMNDDDYSSTYTLRTPYKVSGGVAFLSSMGLITGDVELVDYSSMSFSTSSSGTNNDTNRDIRQLYTTAVNFKVGAEVKLNPIMLRAGFNTNGNPYQDATFKSSTMSGGLGYRINNISIDLTYSNYITKYDTRPYTLSSDYRYFSSTGSGDLAAVKDSRSSVFATIGLRF